MLSQIREFLQDESGPEVIEWTVVTLILLAFSVPAFLAIGQQLKQALNQILAELGGTPVP